METCLVCGMHKKWRFVFLVTFAFGGFEIALEVQSQTEMMPEMTLSTIHVPLFAGACMYFWACVHTWVGGVLACCVHVC